MYFVYSCTYSPGINASVFQRSIVQCEITAETIQPKVYSKVDKHSKNVFMQHALEKGTYENQPATSCTPFHCCVGLDDLLGPFWLYDTMQDFLMQKVCRSEGFIPAKSHCT